MHTPVLVSEAAKRLVRLRPFLVEELLQSRALDRQWRSVAPRLNELCQIPDGITHAVNPGDRRALYYLVRALLPANLLEVGTHVGASTFHISAAMPTGASLTTVDVQDVNDGSEAFWKTFGLLRSPVQMLAEFDRNLDVRFVTSDSLSYLSSTDEEFDLIFLDGSHRMENVLGEVQRSLLALRKGGVILLHDYFPEGKPIWPNRPALTGPFRAIQQLRSAGAALAVVPLGELPWETKLGSRLTSLAVVAGSS